MKSEPISSCKHGDLKPRNFLSDFILIDIISRVDLLRGRNARDKSDWNRLILRDRTSPYISFHEDHQDLPGRYRSFIGTNFHKLGKKNASVILNVESRKSNKTLLYFYDSVDISIFVMLDFHSIQGDRRLSAVRVFTLQTTFPNKKDYWWGKTSLGFKQKDII